MPGTKYQCNQCQETFELLGELPKEGLKCPRCAGRDIGDLNAGSLGIGPPPWEYTCQQCSSQFRVEAPRGPDEAKKIRCPVCESRNIKWLFTVYESCPTGG